MPKIKIKVVLTAICPICGSRQPITKKGLIRKHYWPRNKQSFFYRSFCDYGRSA